MKIDFENKSDNTNYSRKTIVEVSTSSPLTINSESSSVGLSNGQSLVSFSGYYPRLLRGNNTISIESTENSSVVILFPIARWIT